MDAGPEHTCARVATMISSYLDSSRALDEAMCDLAVDDADQAARDHQAFVKAVREERVKDG